MQQRTVFLAVAFTLLAWTIVMCVLEPVMLDGWFLVDWHAKSGSFLDYVRSNWFGGEVWSNPRLGQWAMFPTYESLAWHIAITPLFTLALFALLIVHLRGRWPDPARDGWALLLLVGLAVLGQPQFGVVFFYRPFHANYVIGLVVQLAWLVPYRFAIDEGGGRGRVEEGEGGGAAEAARPSRESIERPPGGHAIPKAIGMLVLGAVAGACNEHTGPALVAAAGIACVWLARRGRLRLWHVVGLVAFAVGFLALVKAPAQTTRYCGLGDTPLVQRIVGRGVVGNLQILFGLVIGGRWMWVGLALAWLVARRPRLALRPAIYWIAIGMVIAMTMIASPKQGGRLLFAGVAFASLGVVLWLEALAADRRLLRGAITLVAIGATGFALARTLAITTRARNDLAERHALVEAGKPGTIVTVPPLRERASRWFLGDDFEQDSLRHRIATQHHLTAIDLAGRSAIPYQFAIRYDAGDGTHGVDRWISLNQCEARRVFSHEVLPALRADHGDAVTAELAILPREPIGRTVVSSRYRNGKLIAPSVTVTNRGGTRYLSLDRGGLEGPLVVTLIGPGKELVLAEQDGSYPYKPWQNGAYWAVVCAGDDCYLASAIRHTGL